MTRVLTAHTAEIEQATLDAARALLLDVFEGDLSDHDWEHALGGVHALAYDGEDLVGHASVIQRRLLHGGRALRTGYVEGVGVRADRRGAGIGTALMRPLHRVIERAYDLGALGATDAAIPLYERLGWQRWRGETWALTPDGPRRTADEDGGIFVLATGVPLDLDGELTCDWRDGDPW